MSNSIKKRGQKFVKKFSRASLKASEESKEHIKENFIERLSHVANIRLLILEWALLVVSLILLAVAQAFWFSDSYSKDVFVSGGTYTEATIGEVNTMNPLFATTNSEKVLSRLMFATLATIDYSGHPGMGLAESITPSENGKVWTVKLRDGLKWSDDEPITNDDVIFTAELIKNPAVNSIYDASLTNVNIKENEQGEIVFTLPSIYADFLSALIFPVVPKHKLENVDPKTLMEDSFSTSPVTSGAFSLNAVQANNASEEEVVYLSANPNYYKGRPMLNSFAIHTYDSREDVIDAVNSGAVTATAELSEVDSDKIVSSQFIERDSTLNSGAFVFFNMSRENVKSKELRTAIRQGIDLTKIREQAEGTEVLDYPLLEGQIKLEKYPELAARDYESAKAKVAELSGENTIKLDVATVNSGYLPSVTNALAEELRGLGFEVNVTVYDENQDFISNVVSKRMYDILVYEMELGADPDLLAYYHSSQAVSSGLNLSNYKNALVDDLLLGARDSMDNTLRAKKYETFLEYWVADVPAIGLYRPNLAYYYNRNVRNFGDNVNLVTPLDRFVNVTEWATTKGSRNLTP